MVGKGRISVLDTETADFHTGDKLVYYEVNAEGDARSIEPKLVETGIDLTVSPIIGQETVNFEIQFDAVSLTGFDGAGLPVLASSSYLGKTRTLDGAEIVSSAQIVINPSDLGATTHNWFGRSQYVDDAYLNGRLDDVVISCRAFTADEIGLLAKLAPP